ncbi:hypothetical protein AYO44_05135 [Planctomycetaceae bacterium SCGC AG-212-F19]|nr:hypothetical protein AYO44_05135 [Planctomycetaceae bacterium SCGC AG-212-F19]
MTEAEWLVSEDPAKMLEFLRGKACDRKLRLFAATCCRSVWHLLPNARSHRAVEAVERFADGLATEQELQQASAGAQAIRKGNRDLNTAVWDATWTCCSSVSKLFEPATISQRLVAGCGEGSRLLHVSLLRDIFGNPFRPATVAPAWQTDTVVSLAQAIYDGRAFDRMPILADALEDAGCTSADVLDHCRGGGEHVRGCWVVDLVLGKE